MRIGLNAKSSEKEKLRWSRFNIQALNLMVLSRNCQGVYSNITELHIGLKMPFFNARITHRHLQRSCNKISKGWALTKFGKIP